ncbi:APC family permease [Jannaschia seohaensis]|uniref:Amino acid transporter n=1 Tax=Jannaschia seohaensis TaxID=475081 RepID=A0A2Y9AXK4_9RHOB|nr:APC family permease [Jannaschia seohaensis]PWJ16119.1 amino acid transporter [Jannaschia seohaensis]SSA48981.1 Amino acid transporter [Jannaschia seohaensis]
MRTRERVITAGTQSSNGEPRLKRSIGLTGLVLYGLGVTIGAGIYVLVGEAVVRAGQYAPAAFLLSAIVMAFTAGTFAELSSRVPQAAGEAVYVEAGFRLGWLTLLVGLAVLIEAMIAAAAIAVGAAGYVAELIALPRQVLIAAIVLLMAAIAAWGIRESVAIAGTMTLIEVVGLLVIIASGIGADPSALAELPASVMPPLSETGAIGGVLAASLIAFFAFIGFDDIVNLVEEAREPRRDLPWAIGITLVLVTLIYVLIAFVAVRAVPVEALAGSSAPISVMFEELTGLQPLVINLIAIMATMNGVVIILIMAARVAYGMARENRLPSWLGKVSERTRTPLRATVVVTGGVLALALFTPLDLLAETTSAAMLFVFFMVNLALIRLKVIGTPPPENSFRVPMIVPVAGALSCVGLLGGAWLIGS